MKKTFTTIVLALTLSISVSAGQVYGSLTEDGRPLPAKVTFEVNCGNQIFKGETDNYGAYSINVGSGKCTFKLFYRGQAPTYDLYSSARPLRYDFDLVRMKDGYQLRRK